MGFHKWHKHNYTDLTAQPPPSDTFQSGNLGTKKLHFLNIYSIISASPFVFLFHGVGPPALPSRGGGGGWGECLVPAAGTDACCSLFVRDGKEEAWCVVEDRSVG